MLTLDVQAIQWKRLKHCLFTFLRHRKGEWSVFWDMMPLFLVESHPQQQDVQSFFEIDVSSCGLSSHNLVQFIQSEEMISKVEVLRMQ